MTNQQIQHVIKHNLFQVFLLTCPCNAPLNFARHHWFVLNNQGVISRWEVLFRKNASATSWGHLQMNAFQPFQGIEILPFRGKYHWKAKLLGFIEGGADSPAKKTVDFIENSKETYQYRYKYSLIGPNSNTYAKWILNNSLEFKIKLSWNSFGKNY